MEIVVPGSVANLGGGFDTLAVAVQLYLRVRVVSVRDTVPGSGASAAGDATAGATLTVAASHPPVHGRNAIERAFAAIARRTGVKAPSVVVEVHSDIPMAAGLGSSAAAAVAGLRIFEAVTAPLGESALLEAATGLEGHGDNAAAAIAGGLTSVIESAGRPPQLLRWTWPDDLQLLIATPSGGLATAKARAALPDTLPRADAVFNLQRVLALVHALERREYHLLREAVGDRWHQPARAALVPQLAPALAIDDPDVLGAFLSGAGPSVALLVRHDTERVERLLATLYERAGTPVTIRTLRVHQPSDVLPDALASAHGRTV